MPFDSNICRYTIDLGRLALFYRHNDTFDTAHQLCPDLLCLLWGNMERNRHFIGQLTLN